MAFIFGDSFDHYSDSQFLRKWDDRNVNAQVNASAGRFSTAGMRSTTSAAARYIKKAVPSLATYVIGHAVYFSSLPASDVPIAAFKESGTMHLNVTLTTGGAIVVKRAGTTVLATSTNIFSASAYNYIEYKPTIHDSTGAFEIRVNGSSTNWVALTGADTRNGGTSGVINEIFLMNDNVGQTGNIDIDDLYICDTSGGTNNDFLGDVRIQAVFPTGAGNYTQWTPSAGSNFQNVDENPSTDDTDYNLSSTATQIDSFVFGDVTPTSGTVYAVLGNMLVRKDDGGSRSIRALARLSGTDATGTAVSVGSSYVNVQNVFETKPGGGAYTIADVNNSEWGYEIVS